MSDQFPNVTAKQAEKILEFLQRTQLTGDEMGDYVDVFNVLSAIVATGQKS